MGKKWIICVLLLFFCSYNADAQSLNSKQSNFHSDIIIVKLKSQESANNRIASSTENPLEKLQKFTNAEQVLQVFPQKKLSNARSYASGLQNIYKIKLVPDTDIWRLLAKLRSSGVVEYAEPYFQNELLYVPNDPQANPTTGAQDYLSVVKAYEAWNLEKSDTNMVIGIVDTGVKLDHEDLQNIAFNYDDPINGIDDDNDGYIDNYYGWDIADEDNDPTADGHPHGTNVVGFSSAATDNGIGMAGIGFNSKYLPVKIAQTSSQKLIREFEGVAYAADHGAKVINLSWGGADNYSQYGQDIINYAVLEKDAVVVAAAGNTNAELDFYPSSFENVLSVGATDINDNKASWATYSYYIDIMAPGDNVYTTKNNGGYEITTGSSFSSPMVAGAAALVRSRFPELNAIQVMEQLRVTSDNIYIVGNNMDYNGQLGRGRLNIQRALSDMLTPSVRMSDLQFESNHGDLIFAGDTVSLEMVFTNYLRRAENLTISISNASDNVSWKSSDIYLSSLGTNEIFSTIDKPFTFVVNQDVQAGDRLLFRIDYLGNFYSDFQYFEIEMTPEYFDISDGNLVATITSDGDLGYDDAYFQKGNGISFQNNFLSDHTGFIISQDKDNVIDNVINSYADFTRDQDFKSEKSLKLYDNSIADYDARSVFKPYDSIPAVLPVKVEQKVLAWDNVTENGFLIFEYRIINIGDSSLNGINAGLFTDWDLGDFEANEASIVQDLKLAYTFDKSSYNQYAGLALITNQELSHFAIDKYNLNGNIADFDTIFSDSVKHEYLSSIAPKNQAGSQGLGNDVAQLLGAHGMVLQPKEATKVTIVMLASSSLDGLKQALTLAKEKYADYLNHPPLEETFYACLGESAIINPSGEIYEFYQDLELTQRLDSGTQYLTPPVTTDAFIYAVNLDSGYYSDVVKLKVSPGDPTANFELSTDTLLIETGKSNQLTIQNTSLLSTSWNWDFSNGYNSLVENPVTQYDTEGNYQIELIASNDYGCQDTTSQDLFVAIRSERPELMNQQICKNTSTTIVASNTNEIRVYDDESLSDMIYEGSAFETGLIKSDSTFFVTNYSGEYESLPTEQKITINYPIGGFEYEMDTTDLDHQYVLTVKNTQGTTDSLYWFIDGILSGRDSSIQFEYSEEAFEILQVKIDMEGCSDSISTTVKPAFSTMPDNINMEVCKNTDFHIVPTGGETFHFYTDQELNQLVHKGHSYTVNGINQATSFYITSVDQLLEGPSATIEVNPNPVKATISVAADSILLEAAIDVEIINTSEYDSTSFWVFPTGVYDTTSVLIEQFENIGEYNYQLVALSADGCSDTTSQKITVYNITGLQDIANNTFRIFPNPTSSELTIDLGEKTKKPMPFQLMNATGQIVHQFTIPENQTSSIINLTPLPPGIYFIRYTSSTMPGAFKVVKE